jgi:hypothetical protein
MTAPQQESHSHRPLWAALLVLTAAAVGGVAGMLAAAGGTAAPNAVLTGSGAFASAMILLLAIAHFLERDSS